MLWRLLIAETSPSTDGKGTSGSRSSPDVEDDVDDGVKRGVLDVVLLGAGDN